MRMMRMMMKKAPPSVTSVCARRTFFHSFFCFSGLLFFSSTAQRNAHFVGELFSCNSSNFRNFDSSFISHSLFILHRLFSTTAAEVVPLQFHFHCFLFFVLSFEKAASASFSFFLLLLSFQLCAPNKSNLTLYSGLEHNL